MIKLVPIGKVNSNILKCLVKPIADVFDQNVEIGDTLGLPSEICDSKRGQYPADLVLDLIPATLSGDIYLGISDVDIFAFGLNFIFGAADARTKKALISLKRLRPEFYGLSPDENLFKERTVKEAVHEIGHTCGLRHCPNLHCVMHFSNSVKDTDMKGWQFCALCQRRIVIR
jgi:archaemetzincin